MATGRRKIGMTGNLIPIYGCAVLTITMLGAFARQNRKSGWKRNRLNVVEALETLYADLGLAQPEATPMAGPEWKPVSVEEAIGFSAQMLKLRGALGTGTPVTLTPQVEERELSIQ